MLCTGGGSPRLLSRTCLPAHSRPGSAGKKATGDPFERSNHEVRETRPDAIARRVRRDGMWRRRRRDGVPSHHSVVAQRFFVRRQLLGHGHAERPARGRKRPGRCPSARHHLVHTVGQLRHAVLDESLQMAGYSASEFKIDNAQGNDATQIAQAQADITQGAKVLVVAQLDGPTATTIQAAAAAKGVKVIAYDRAIFTGTNTYYVSFDNVQVGKLIGQGFKDCLTAWNV